MLEMVRTGFFPGRSQCKIFVGDGGLFGDLAFECRHPEFIYKKKKSRDLV